MEKMRRKISKDEISQSIDLKKYLGKNPSKEQKNLFFDLFVNKMVERTTSGNDIDGKKFEKYSEKYAEQKGVDINSVDLVLDGNMLGDIERDTSAKGSRVKIKIDENDLLKSFNHSVGDTLPKRDFFGFKDDEEIKDIIKQVEKIAPKKETKTEGEPGAIDLVSLRQAIEQIRISFGDIDGEG